MQRNINRSGRIEMLVILSSKLYQRKLIARLTSLNSDVWAQNSNSIWWLILECWCLKPTRRFIFHVFRKQSCQTLDVLFLHFMQFLDNFSTVFLSEKRWTKRRNGSRSIYTKQTKKSFFRVSTCSGLNLSNRRKCLVWCLDAGNQPKKVYKSLGKVSPLY